MRVAHLSAATAIKQRGRHPDCQEAGKAIVHAMFGVKRGNKSVIGKLAGFHILAKATDLEFGKRLMLVGTSGVEYEAGRAETPIGYVKVLENALGRMEEVLAEERERLARTEKRMADIQAEIAKSFDKAERLAWLQQRQKQIEAMLDLTKGDMAAADEAEVSEAG